MRNTDITLVFQGAFKPYITRDGDWYAQNIRAARRVLPGAKIILSTWKGTEIPSSLAVDDVVFSIDPGGLAPLKLDDDKANNVNRQLVSTAAGLAAVTTSHAVKIRTDCSLHHAGFLDFYGEQVKLDMGQERLLACSFFTLDPTVFECVPFHLSDWFHFGRTELLQTYWSAPPLTGEQARFYERNRHMPGSSFFEKKFRAKFAAEQHICSHFARMRGYRCPQFLNDAPADVMHDYYRFLATEVIVLDPWQIGLDFKKYNWVGGSLFQCMNNLMHLDWLQIAGQESSSGADPAGLRRLIAERGRKKDIVRAGFRYSRSLHPFMFDPKRGGAGMRRAAHRVLRYL
ncbi:MAG: hypothetical protein H7234_09310 [Herminiimonas sp.]|nr:hypothetical protein [Herminiimonas sp.]